MDSFVRVEFASRKFCPLRAATSGNAATPAGVHVLPGFAARPLQSVPPTIMANLKAYIFNPHLTWIDVPALRNAQAMTAAMMMFTEVIAFRYSNESKLFATCVIIVAWYRMGKYDRREMFRLIKSQIADKDDLIALFVRLYSDIDDGVLTFRPLVDLIVSARAARFTYDTLTLVSDGSYGLKVVDAQWARDHFQPKFPTCADWIPDKIRGWVSFEKEFGQHDIVTATRVPKSREKFYSKTTPPQDPFAYLHVMHEDLLRDEASMPAPVLDSRLSTMDDDWLLNQQELIQEFVDRYKCDTEDELLRKDMPVTKEMREAKNPASQGQNPTMPTMGPLQEPGEQPLRAARPAHLVAPAPGTTVPLHDGNQYVAGGEDIDAMLDGMRNTSTKTVSFELPDPEEFSKWIDTDPRLKGL